MMLGITGDALRRRVLPLVGMCQDARIMLNVRAGKEAREGGPGRDVVVGVLLGKVDGW